MVAELVLSLFPGVGLLDRAFAAERFSEKCSPCTIEDKTPLQSFVFVGSDTTCTQLAAH